MNRYKAQQIGIELVKGCNFTCQMCPVPLYREAGAWQFMSLDLLDKIVTEIEANDSVTTIWLAHLGEPLAHSELQACLEIIERIHHKFRRQVILHTNASLLQNSKVTALLTTNAVTDLTFSFDGFGDKASYEFLRGEHYDDVLHNIIEFSQQARLQRPDLKLLTCSVLPKKSEMTGWKGDIPEPAKVDANYKRLFNPIGVEVQHREMIDFSGNESLPIAGHKKQKVFGGCHFVEQDSLYFTASGKAQPCCAVYNEEFNVGSIQQHNFDSLLNNKSMNNLRHTLRTDQRDKLPFCKNCSLSIGGDLSGKQLRKFWSERQTKYPLSIEEEQHIFGVLGADPIHSNTSNETELLLNILQNRVNNKNAAADSKLPIGFIDNIQLIENKLIINAWAVDEKDASPLTNFQVYVDNKVREISKINFLMRPDVAKHWQKEEWLFSGVRLEIDNVPVGKYLIKLEIVNSGGLSTFLSNNPPE